MKPTGAKMHRSRRALRARGLILRFVLFGLLLGTHLPGVQAGQVRSQTTREITNFQEFDDVTLLPELLTRVSDIRILPRSLAAQAIPIHLEGVITYADPEWRTCFFQDKTGGIYIDPGPDNLPQIAPGQWVIVTGRTDPGRYAPQVIDPVFQILGSTNMPPPARVALADYAYGNLDAQWVELEGVVRRVFDEWGHVYLTIMTPSGRFKALFRIPPNTPPPFHLIDALVSVRGACTSEINNRGQLAGVILNVPSLDYVTVLEQRPTDPFAVPAIPIASVATFHPDRLAGRRVKVRGVVTLALPGQGFYLQDGSGGIRVESPETNSISRGDLADVLGFPAVGDYSPYLEEATFRGVASGPMPSPARTTAEQILLAGTNDASVVTLDVRLLQNAPHSATPRFVVQDGPIVFTASLAGSSSGVDRLRLTAGCRLRLTGVCSIQSGENREPTALRLLLARAEDITILRRPPWWTARHTIVLCGSLTLAVALALIWIASLRRTVEAQTRAIREKLDEKNRFAESLAREKNLLGTLIDSLPDKVFVKDQAGRYVLANRAFMESHGLASQEEATGKTVFDLFPKDEARAYAVNDRQVLREGQSIFDKEALVCRPGAAPQLLSTTKVPLKDSAGNRIGLVGITRDITRQREIETYMHRAQKMETVGQLAAGVAHDFNNLLTVILARCDLLLRVEASAAIDDQSLRDIISAAERGANLVRQLLTFSRRQSSHPELVDLNALVSRLLEVLPSSLGEHIDLERACDPDLPPVLADPGMIEQVLINLSVNARDAMPLGGRLTIRTEIVTIDSKSASRHSEARPGRYVTLTVADTGHGMDTTTLSHLFEPFFTTKDVGKGTGLGLASVYGIAKEHDGWVEVASQPQIGSRFTVFLPAPDAPNAGGETTNVEAADAVPRGVETILVVEDESALRSLVESFLIDCGYRVFVAESGKAALPLWEKHKSEIDLLLTDLVMPGGLRGTELAQCLTAEKPALKTIFTSGYSAEMPKAGRFLDSPANFLAKPFTPAVLAKLVRECLDQTRAKP